MLDWIISITTLVANSCLGYYKGKMWTWIVHIINCIFWIIYAFSINQFGLIILSVFTICIDIVLAYKMRAAITK